MTSQPRLAPSPNAVYTRLDDDSAAVLDLASKRYYTLNATGIAIWEALAEGHTSEEIATAVHEQYQITLDEARDQVASFLEELRGEGLLEPGRDP